MNEKVLALLTFTTISSICKIWTVLIFLAICTFTKELDLSHNNFHT